MGRVGGDVEHPEQLPVWPEQRAGAAAQKAVLGEEVLIAEHLYLALFGQRGADGVGALARLPSGHHCAKNALGVAGETVVTAGCQDGPSPSQQQPTGTPCQQLAKQRQHETLEAGDQHPVLLLAGRQLPWGSKSSSALCRRLSPDAGSAARNARSGWHWIEIIRSSRLLFINGTTVTVTVRIGTVPHLRPSHWLTKIRCRTPFDNVL